MYFLADLLLLILLTILARTFAYFPIDLSATQSLQQINYPWFDAFMKFLSYIGEPERFIPIALMTGFIVLVYKRKEGTLILLSFIGLGVVGEVLKIFVNRPRPNPLLIHQFIPEIANDSYPSGHVLFYLGLFGPLLYIINLKMKKSPLKRLTQLILWLLIFLIGISRVYLGEHWLSDVVGSYLIGIAWFYVFLHLLPS